MKKKYLVGILIGNIFSRYSKDLMTGAYDASQDEDCTVFYFVGTQSSFFYQDIRNTGEGKNYDSQFNTIYDYAKYGNLDILIIAYETLSVFFDNLVMRDFLAKFKGIPILLLEKNDPTGRISYIANDNNSGYGFIMEHLAGFHGYRKIGHISGPIGSSDADERRKVYRQVMSKYRLPVPESMIVYGDFSQYIEETVETLLNSHPDLEAICAANDDMAMAAYNVCKKRGIVVGRDIAITGYGDYSIAVNLDPPLTTVDLNAFQTGYDALKSALALCRDNQDRAFFRGKKRIAEYLTPKFRVRCSCGCQNDALAQHHIKPTVLIEHEKEFMDFQKKVWTGPLVVRDMIRQSRNEKAFFRSAFSKMNVINIPSAYIYIFKEPIPHRAGDAWKCPQEMHLASYLIDGNIVAFEPEDRPVITIESGFDCSNTWKTGQSLVAFTLSAEDTQFGVLLCDMSPQDITSMYVVSLQLGTALSFLELSKLEHQASKKLLESLEIIQEKNMVLSHISSYDALTGLLNRRGFMEQAIAFCHENMGKRACLAFADLDHLKQINDYFGHTEGDYAIRTCSQVIDEVFCNIGIVARLGGDEFIALSLAENFTDSQEILQRIKNRFHQINQKSGKSYYVECSAGIKTFVCKENSELLDAIEEADSFLYEAKKDRRPDVRVKI